MSNLVPIPWQPGYKLTPDTLAYLVAAGKKLGTQLQVVDAWRSYAEQAYYYDQYINHGGNPASNPDTGQRNHMRGAAFDLARTDATVQAACKSVGLIRDADESWHWNNPYWANMPIIPTDDGTADDATTPADDGATNPIKPAEEIFMKDAAFKSSTNATVYLYIVETGAVRAISGNEWAILTAADPTLKAVVLTPAQTSSIVNGHLVERVKGR
jgi:hypothetical protein